MHCETAMGLQAPGLLRKVRSGSGVGQLCPGSLLCCSLKLECHVIAWGTGNGLRGACLGPSKGKD